MSYRHEMALGCGPEYGGTDRVQQPCLIKCWEEEEKAAKSKKTDLFFMMMIIITIIIIIIIIIIMRIMRIIQYGFSAVSASKHYGYIV